MQSIAALRIFAIVVVVAWCGRSAQAAEAVSRPAAEPAPHVSVTILATHVGDVHLHSTAGFATTQGEWSFSAWVEVDGRAFLFDTGWSPRNVLENATVLGIDLSVAEDLILSHHHPDHVGGLETLRTELSKRNPKALSRIHVAQGIFASRPGPDGSERNPMRAMQERLEATGVTFIVYSHATEVMPQVWVTGPVPRPHNERNYPQGPKWVIEQNEEIVPDIIPENQSLVLVTPDGPIIISGCGHAGLINTLEYVKTKVSDQAPQAAIGRFHLYAASEEVLRWTSEAVAKRQLGYFLGSHCTGLECVYRIREHAGMDRAHARIGAIGTRYTSGQGIIPRNINR